MSVRHLTDASGAITDSYDYTAFGEMYNQTGTTVNPYRYTGQYQDSATGLYNLRARHYDPGVGRFLSRDTYAYNFQNPIELNRYGYAAGNPVRYSDPSGNMMLHTGILNLNSGFNANVALPSFAYGIGFKYTTDFLAATATITYIYLLSKRQNRGGSKGGWGDNWDDYDDYYHKEKGKRGTDIPHPPSEKSRIK